MNVMMFLEPQPRKPYDLNDGGFSLSVLDARVKNLEKEPSSLTTTYVFF